MGNQRDREEVHDRAEGAEENCVERERDGERLGLHTPTYPGEACGWGMASGKASERASEGASQPTIVAACSNGNGRREGGRAHLAHSLGWQGGRPRSLVSNSHQAL